MNSSYHTPTPHLRLEVPAFTTDRRHTTLLRSRRTSEDTALPPLPDARAEHARRTAARAPSPRQHRRTGPELGNRTGGRGRNGPLCRARRVPCVRDRGRTAPFARNKRAERERCARAPVRTDGPRRPRCEERAGAGRGEGRCRLSPSSRPGVADERRSCHFSAAMPFQPPHRTTTRPRAAALADLHCREATHPPPRPRRSSAAGRDDGASPPARQSDLYCMALY